MTTATRPPDPIVDLTTVPTRNAAAVADLLAGRHGEQLRALTRNAASRALMGHYLHDASAILLDVVLHGGQLGGIVAIPGGVSA